MKSSLKVAKGVLRSKGYEIIAENSPINISGFKVSDVDLLAKKDGVLYAVEVKSGRIDVGGLRQAYVNALLLNAKPLVICRGFSDQSAEVLARELSIEVMELEDLFISDPRELRILIREEMRSTLMEILPSILKPPILDEEDRSVIRAIARSESFLDAAESLKLDPDELGRKLGEMKREGKIPRWVGDYSQIREWSSMLVKFFED